ncbi:Putative mycofactocin system creatinine amidohydrolase family protein MftE [Rubrobacter xylanophilus DSM 9941]|uniref:mycofactocin biosynthesis peptidyl-dipeptidase MftE n=1 Tax=Rubrobacter xylanophilus TaxID=49319 RepID=UPI001C644A46|nr:mycofactocin biosynthesis peptidyl-dipeptidase MftE [Rubrobacter xylanophilus]QYJ16137.1 Putative mycofactocin system creatinine amidohydrolase family protein MftE [Rubrobacter xylanophilus DSM 9941]
MGDRLAEMSWPEVERAVAAGATTVLLPLGATEQHGPHLPLGTDTVRAEALAGLLAERLPGALVAPALPFGCSDEHAGFPGLLGVGKETLARLIVDLARRMAGWGVERLVLLSAHGGNGEALSLARAMLRSELPGLAVWAPEDLTSLSPATAGVARRAGVPEGALGLHAGEGETSEMLHLRPELVRRERVRPGYTGDMESVVKTLKAGGLRAAHESGVLGDPTLASAGRGASYLEARAEEIARAVLGDPDGGR